MYPPFYPMMPLMPMIPNLFKLQNDYPEPPAVYALLNSYVNFGKPEDQKIKIADLAKTGRSMFFDFDYPLTDLMTKEDFESMILNHFMMARIGFETVTAFKLQLSVKINSIMPVYNKMFEAINGWDLFNSGETITKQSITATEDSSEDHITGTGSSSTTTDNRYSNTPQNQLSDVQSGKYVSEYTYNTIQGSDQTSSTKTGSSEGNSNTNETITRTPADKIRIYNEFKMQKAHIFDMIFTELECLFYQII